MLFEKDLLKKDEIQVILEPSAVIFKVIKKPVCTAVNCMQNVKCKIFF